MRGSLLVFMLILVMMLAGCAPEKPAQQASPVFRVLVTDKNARLFWGRDAISAEIKKRTGVELQIDILDTDIDDQLVSMTSLGNFPDMILSVDNDTISTMAAKGLLVPLDDYIREDTNIFKVFGNGLQDMRSEADGKIYGVNRAWRGEPSNSDAVFFIQYAVLAHFGYPDVTQMTLAQLLDMLESYKNEYPAVNGQETLGITCWGDSFGMNVTINNPALRASGFQNDGNYAVYDDLSVKYGLRTPQAKEFFRYMNDAYRRGLLDAEGFVQDRVQFVKKVASGAALCVMTEYWDLGDSEALLRNNGMADRCYLPVPIRLNAQTDISAISAYDSKGTWKSVITTACKDPGAAFAFFDMMWSDEMQVLVNWGIEGVHYSLENGKRVMKDEFIQQAVFNPDWKSDTALTIYGMWSYGDNVKDKNGEYYNFFTSKDFLQMTADSQTQAILKAYNTDSFRSLCPPANESSHTFVWKLNLSTNTPGALAEQHIDDVLRRTYLPKAVLCPDEASFEASWQEFMLKIDQTDIALREAEIRQRLILGK